ncbi:MAG: hypothetical protein Q9175_004653 [Cornicularia normoerica]
MAANNTLGFQKLLALAKAPSWRSRGLEAAAKITNLTIEIPKQSSFTEELINAFMELGPKESKHPGRGSAVAWLAHLDMIKFVIASDLDTAMIMEDDVDWDVAIKEQMPLISDAVRNFSRVDPSDPAPYGRSWDVLWLGHCGEVTENNTLRLEFNDTTLGRPAPWEFYAGWSKFAITNVKESHRVVQMAKLPVCSFGYALNRENAQKVLTWAGRGADEAFDVVLSVGCREGHLKCITINPEIMHHYNPADAHGYVSQVQAGDGKGSESKEADFFESVKGQTANIFKQIGLPPSLNILRSWWSRMFSVSTETIVFYEQPPRRQSAELETVGTCSKATKYQFCKHMFLLNGGIE